MIQKQSTKYTAFPSYQEVTVGTPFDIREADDRTKFQLPYTKKVYAPSRSMDFGQTFCCHHEYIDFNRTDSRSLYHATSEEQRRFVNATVSSLSRKSTSRDERGSQTHVLYGLRQLHEVCLPQG